MEVVWLANHNAHTYFGLQVLGQLPPDLRELCTEDLPVFHLGLYGPDPLIFSLWTKKISDRLHKRWREESLPDLTDAIQTGSPTARSFAAGPNGMVGGQVLDLLGEGNSLQEEEILAIESLKTGCMIEAAARLGAIAAGSTPEEEAAAAAYARKLGLAFQVRDDILDVMGDEGEFGKPIGSDQANQKSTFVALKGIAACEAWVQELTQEAVAFLAPFSGREFLCELAHFLARRTK